MAADTPLLTQVFTAMVGAVRRMRVAITEADGTEVSVATSAKQDTAQTRLNLLATEAKQDTLIAKDYATQTTLAALLAKFIAAPATEAKQDTGNTSLSTIAGMDFATQTTLAAILSKLIAAPATEATIEAVRVLLAGVLDVQLTGSATGKSVSVSQTRPGNTTPYTALDVVGQDAAANMEFATGLPVGSTFLILSAALRIDVAAIPAGMTSFRLHLYNAAPTAIADNTAYNLPAADRAKYLGSLDISGVTDIGDTLFAQASGVNFMGKLAAASSTIYGILQTIGAFTPTASATKTVALNITEI